MIGGRTAFNGRCGELWWFDIGACVINEFVIDAIRCNGLAFDEKSSVGVIAGGKIELPNGLGAADDAVVVGVVPGSGFGRTILNADDEDDEYRASSPSLLRSSVLGC